MQKHLDFGRHCFRLQKDSTYDSVKLKWAACNLTALLLAPRSTRLEWKADVKHENYIREGIQRRCAC